MFIYWDGVSLYNPDCPGTWCIDLADLEPIKLGLPLPPARWINDVHHHVWPADLIGGECSHLFYILLVISKASSFVLFGFFWEKDLLCSSDWLNLSCDSPAFSTGVLVCRCEPPHSTRTRLSSSSLVDLCSAFKSFFSVLVNKHRTSLILGKHPSTELYILQFCIDFNC